MPTDDEREMALTLYRQALAGENWRVVSGLVPVLRDYGFTYAELAAVATHVASCGVAATGSG